MYINLQTLIIIIIIHISMPFLQILFFIFIYLPQWIYSACIHDQITKNKISTFVNDTHQHHQRLLQGLGSGPIRIHYQYNTTTINDNDIIGKNIKKIMNIINQFWYRTIEIDYLPSLSYQIPIMFNRDNYQCLTFTVPRRILDNPIPNRDFGLLIEAQDDGDSGVTAYSYPCANSNVNNRTLWGFIHWNKHYLSFSPLNFQQNLHIGIHQILHVLGFSQMLYPHFKNSQLLVNVEGDFYLNGTYIRNQVIRQYGCQNPPGMTLQTNGGDGTAMSHWARKTASNQLMTAGVAVNNPTISHMTLALLQQTGWYRKIYKNLGKFINFGYQKGCSMLNPKNCNSDEYCRVKDQKKPDYDRTALGYCKNDSLSKCFYVKFYVNFICTDPNYAEKSLHAEQGVINITGQSGGMKSRCFTADLRINGQKITKYNFRCYETICSPSGRTLTIKIGNTIAFCMFPNQVITVRGYEGTLRCPDSFAAICAVKRCQNECNANGICLHDQCLCDPNYQGPSCSQLSSLGFSSKKSLLLPAQNGNCIEGSYRSQFGDCVPCVQGCQRCNKDGCIVCLNQNAPVRGKCLKK